ncbi:MAG TPA: J domain-containing protein [Candidatus Limnocylindria bacterium]|nr:J domain-containing protein [Candidatus Limnocylindria bacterium]
MPSEPISESMRTERRDYYEVLGAEPSATVSELRAAFRQAVLRHHPDRSASSELATRRTSMLNRAWSELRDPLRRLHYDRALETGTAATLAWPLEEHEASRGPRPRRGAAAERPSRWHQPQWRSVAGFRVPAEVFLAGPAAQEAWIVRHHIAGEDWREHSERYWLRYAANHYREHGLTDDWLGALERLVELDPTYDTLIGAHLREAYSGTGALLRGVAIMRHLLERYPAGSAPRRWLERELRALLGEFRDRHVRRGGVDERAENAELLLNYLEALDLEPSFPDIRAAIVAHRRAGHPGRAAELVERLTAVPPDQPGRWYSLVQVLTEAGQLDRASTLLAEIARGERPDALDPRKIGGNPVRRISAARRRLAAARKRTQAAIDGGVGGARRRQRDAAEGASASDADATLAYSKRS